MKLFSFSLVCGHLVDQLEVDKMMKKIKKNSTLFGDQLQKSNSLNKDMLLITSVTPPSLLGNNGTLLFNLTFTKKINLSLKSMLLLFIPLD